ncbi:MAG: transposase [Candidatus Omnitrophota bacterium]
MLYCGVDLHKHSSYVTVMNEQGQLLKQTKLPNTQLKNFFSSLDDKSTVAVESTNNTSRFSLNGYLTALENLSMLIKEVSALIDRLAQDSPDTQQLMTIPGIGSYSAMLIKCEVGDITRFYSSKHFSSYCGLVPSTSSSAERTFHGPIGNKGSKYLRWILIEAANQPHLYKGPLHEFYQRIKDKKGDSKATVALARKLSVVVYFILKNNFG